MKILISKSPEGNSRPKTAFLVHNSTLLVLGAWAGATCALSVHGSLLAPGSWGAGRQRDKSGADKRWDDSQKQATHLFSTGHWWGSRSETEISGHWGMDGAGPEHKSAFHSLNLGLNRELVYCLRAGRGPGAGCKKQTTIFCLPSFSSTLDIAWLLQYILKFNYYTWIRYIL